MDYYYSSSPSMSSRGRFSSRGGSSYRGGGRGDSTYRGSRGSYSSSRGSYSTSRGRGTYYPKYENSGSKYSTETRYGSHGRMEEPSYRKAESSSYGSSREHSHHRQEVEIGRKRMRSDSYSQSQGAGSRRSHEAEEYRGGGSRYSNANSYTESRSYSENRAVFKKPRVSEYKPKEEYRGRKETIRSSVPVTKLRSFRGRPVRGRGIVRRGGDSFLARKRAAYSDRSASASTLLALRRAKLLKIRRLREKAKLLAEEKSRDGKSGGEDEEDDGEDKLEGDEDKEEEEERSKKKDDGEIDDDEKDRSKKEEDRIDFFGKPFMKLQCPHCSTKCITFKEYVQHLYQPTHVKAMRDKSVQLKATLAKMRIAQRAKQKKTDEEDLTSMNTRTIFCPICKLNYSQDKSVHQASEAHKKMKNFLQPYCRICRISYKSPMLYESHVCSLDHIRRKNALDERLGKSKGANLEYLDNFMVLDSVGSGDELEDVKEEETEKEKEKEETVKKEKEKEKEEKTDDEDMNLGVEFIRKVEVFYCEVCRTYLPRLRDEERNLRIHCRTKNHLRCYLRFGSDELLDQIKAKDVKKEEEKPIVVKSEPNPEKSEAKEKENHDETIDDDVALDEKTWEDVGMLLNEVEPEVKSEDDDEEEGGRFDRFKSNEKKENGELAAAETVVQEEKPVPESETAEDSKTNEAVVN